MGKTVFICKMTLIVVSLVICGALAISQGVQAGTTQPGADFKISDLVLPGEVGAGEKVTISATITNTANYDGNYESTLKINGLQEATKVVNVPPKATKTISFVVSRKELGTYEVDLDGITGSFRVIASSAEPDTGFPTVALVGIVIGATALAALVAFWIFKRRPARA